MRRLGENTGEGMWLGIKKKAFEAYHAAAVGCRCTVDDRTPDVEVLACTADGVWVAFVAFLSAGRGVVAV